MKTIDEEKRYKSLENEEKYRLALERLTKPERRLLREWLANHKFESLYDKKKSGNTALHVAASEGNLNIVEIIIKADKRTLYAQDKAGFTPLHEAVQNNQIEIVKHIIGVDIKTLLKQDKTGQMPLHIAIITANNKMVELIISADKKTIYIKDKNGLTPLHLAATFDNSYVAELISSLDYTLLSVADNNGNLPVDYTEKESKTYTFFETYKKYLKKKCANPETPDIGIDLSTLFKNYKSTHTNETELANFKDFYTKK